MKKAISVIVAALTALTLLTGCGTESPSESAGAGHDTPSADSITIALPAQVTTFHLFTASAVNSDEQVCQAIQDPLFFLPNSSSEPVMKLAESYTVSDDNLTLTFHLREGIMFSDGTPITSADVKYSYEKQLEIQKDYVWAQSVVSLETPDEQTFVINLSQYVPTFLNDSVTLIIPEGSVEDPSFNDSPVCSGPYKVVSYTPGDSVVLAANEYYYGEAPAIANVTYRTMSSPSANSIALEAGDIQLSTNLPSVDYEYLDELDNVSISTFVSANIFDVVFFNNTMEPFDNADFRKAICYATDRQMMIDTIFGGYGQVATTVCAASSPAFDSSIEGYPYDLEKAAEHLAAAGYPNGDGLEPLTITVYTDVAKTMAEILQSSLNQLGITVTIEITEASAAAERLYAGEIPFGILGTGTTTLHGSAFAEFFTGYFAPMLSHYNETEHYDEVAALFAEAAAETNADRQNEIYRSIWQITDVEDAAYDPVNYRVSVYGADSSLDLTEAVDMVMAYGLNPYYMNYN